MGSSDGNSDDPSTSGRGSGGFGSGSSWFKDTGPVVQDADRPGSAPRPGLASTTSPTNPVWIPNRAPSDADALSIDSPRSELAKVIPRRPRVSWWLGMVLAVAFALLATPSVTAERWLGSLGAGKVELGKPSGLTVRVAPFAGAATRDGHVRGGGVIVARGATPDRAQFDDANDVQRARPRGPLPYVAVFLLTLVLAAIFTHHMRRSTRGRLVRVQVVSLATIAVLAVVIEIVMLTTALSILVVPVALLAMVPTMVLDRIVGLATGILAALITALLVPFDVGVAILLLVQAAVGGLMVAEHPKNRWRAAFAAGGVTTLFTVATYVLVTYLTTGVLPSFSDPLHSPWLAAAFGPAIATLLVVPSVPIYQLLVGEITQGKLIELEDLSHPLLRQIAEKAPGTWQHSLMMANMAEIAANAIGASGRMVRVGAYYHDLGKSLQPKYFIENLEPGETSPHDQLPPEVSCDAIFAHVTEGIVTARRARLHERIVDFMHMHHGDGVLEYFWGKTKEQGNPRGLSIEQFRYPGHPPQTRETAILAICDAVEAASRTLKKPEPAAIESLVQRIVYGKLHLGQLDESGLSMSDLRRVSDSLRETIRHANHGRIEYPWQKAQQDASASVAAESGLHPRLDSLDRVPRRDTAVKPVPRLEVLDDEATPVPPARTSPRPDAALAETADLAGDASPSDEALAIVDTAPAQRVRAGRSRSRSPSDDSSGVGAPGGDPRIGRANPASDTRVGRALADDPRATAGAPRAGDTFAPRIADDRSTRVGRAEVESAREPSGPHAPLAAPVGPPPDVITPGTFDRQRAAALPPTAAAARRPPTGPPPNTERRPQPEQWAEPAQVRPARPPTTPVAPGQDEAWPAEPRPARPPTAQPVAAAAQGEVWPAEQRTPTGERRPASAGERRAATPTPGEHRAATPMPGQRRAATPTPGERRAATPTPGERRPATAQPPGDVRPPAEPSRADTGSPARKRRSPSGEQPFDPRQTGERRTPAIDPAAVPTRHAGPPAPVELENMVTNPPPLRRAGPSPATRLPALIVEDAGARDGTTRRRADKVDDARVAGERRAIGDPPLDLASAIDEARITGERAAVAAPPPAGPASLGDEGRPTLERIVENPVSLGDRVTRERIAAKPPAEPAHQVGDRRGVFTVEDASRTEPSLPRFELPPQPPGPLSSDAAITLPGTKATAKEWSDGLADRIDKALDSDEWGTETPIRPPTKAELRSLLGVPDPTREQSIDELEALHRAAKEYKSSPDILAEPPPPPPPPRSRPLPNTAEVDPDDIEAAIELAPPAARRPPNAVAVARPKKPE